MTLARGVFEQVAHAVEALHQRGLIHRDLKPENVFLVGGGEYAVLLDFGIAKDLEAGATNLYDLDVPSGGQTVWAEGGTDTFGTVLDEWGSEVAVSDDDGPDLNFEIHIATPGSYTLQVRGFSTSTSGPFELLLGRDHVGSRPGRLCAHVDHVGTFTEQCIDMSLRCLMIQILPAVEERIRSRVDDGHDDRAACAWQNTVADPAVSRRHRGG